MVSDKRKRNTASEGGLNEQHIYWHFGDYTRMFGQLVIRSHKRLRRELRLKWPGEIYQLAFSMPATQKIALTS